MIWDVGDQSVFYPLTRLFVIDPAGESVDVNALDEVPDSSWFENRIGLHGMSPEQTALGPCEPGSGPPPTPWLVTGAKPNGANPGFIIKDASGQRHLVKFDGLVQGPRATADVNPNGSGSRMESARNARSRRLNASIASYSDASSVGSRGMSTGVDATSSAIHNVSIDSDNR